MRYVLAMIPREFPNVTVVPKANVYFDGRVVSHTLIFADGSKKTIGLIYSGQYHFGTDRAERMEIVAGECIIQLDDHAAFLNYSPGGVFEVPAKSGFSISVASGICEYICSYL